MKQATTGGIFWLILIISFSPLWGLEKGKIITAGDFFPEFPFPMALSRGEVGYLGLPTKFLGLTKGENFFLREVKAELIVLEYTNKYCFSCQLLAPVMNKVFERVENDERLRGRVKFLGVGAGNNRDEVNSFKAEKKVPFPIVPDPKFQAFEAVGEPGATPFTLFIRNTSSGLLVVRVKIGLTREPEKLLSEINESLRADWRAMMGQEKDLSLQEAKAMKLSHWYNEDQLREKARESMSSPKWKVRKVMKVILPGGEEIYAGEIQTGNQKSYLFAKLASRAPICDLCHATHFFFAFDEKGMVVNFLPLEVTKADNAPWDEKEIDRMRRRLIGRSILHPTDFNPEVDSISSATMTAALIVGSVNEAKSLYEGLKTKGYIK